MVDSWSRAPDQIQMCPDWDTIGPSQDPVTWYGINYTGTQITQWDFQNKGKSGWTGKSSFVLEVPQRYLRPSVIYSVPCDRILQRAYCWTFELFSDPRRIFFYFLLCVEEWFIQPTTAMHY